MTTPKKPAAAKKNAKANKAAKAKAAKAKAKRDAEAADTTETGVNNLVNEVIADGERDSSMTDLNAENSDGRSTPAQPAADTAENGVAAGADSSPVATGDEGSKPEENILQTIISNIEIAVAAGHIKKDCARGLIDDIVANDPKKQPEDFVVVRIPIADLSPSGYGTSKKYLPTKLNEQRLNQDQGRGLGRVLSALFNKVELKNGQLVSTKERAIRYILDLINDALPN